MLLLVTRTSSWRQLALRVAAISQLQVAEALIRENTWLLENPVTKPADMSRACTHLR